jgi:hypothetical protein
MSTSSHRRWPERPIARAERVLAGAMRLVGDWAERRAHGLGRRLADLDPAGTQAAGTTETAGATDAAGTIGR